MQIQMDNNRDDNKRNDGNVEEMNDRIDKSEEKVERDETSETSTSWWGNWVQSAKDKSSIAYEFLKRDLNELKETVQKDATDVVSNTASYVSQTMRDTITGISHTVESLYDEEVQTHDSGRDEDRDQVIDSENIKQKDDKNDNIIEPSNESPIAGNSSSDDWTINLTNKAKQKLNTLIGSIADAFVINRNYFEDEEDMYVVSGDKLVAIEQWKRLLTEIQTDPKTFCHEPSGPPEHYESWLMTFNLFDFQRQIDHLLDSVPQIKQIYSQLVPNSLSDVDFWHRYYYKVHQIREMERNKIEAKSQIKESSDESSNVNQFNKVVEIKLLEENSSLFACNDIKQELISIASNECSDIISVNDTEDSTPSPETGSEEWEKTDINEIGDDSKILNEKCYASDEDIKDWVKYE